MPTADRRTRIADAAVAAIAANGLRALTHRALDTALGLPAGSVSYYFRTRDALLTAVAERITERSRADFENSGMRRADARTPERRDETTASPATETVAREIAEWLDRLLVERRDDLLARHALILDGGTAPEVRDRLADSLFSVERARELLASWGIEHEDAAEDLVAVLEGAVFDRFAGRRRGRRPGTAASVTQLTGLVTGYLRGVRGH
ncbi:MAG TPA: TetR family transcriptional regulator [Nocardia sp.]|uniref:TetR/AcrR family transcriptional regulator n=1 Tax=Nocardia TaxID=1817 RepID=UPI0024556C44|nr:MULTISPECIES: TetR family transcriptional regulator [Nocardia]HLS77418.1 TetR family transcriptional regulator [Nocardia sp.]